MERQADGAYPAHWNWSNGTTVEVWAYSNCDTVELFLNGTSLGVKSMGNNGMFRGMFPGFRVHSEQKLSKEI